MQSNVDKRDEFSAVAQVFSISIIISSSSTNNSNNNRSTNNSNSYYIYNYLW